MAKKIILFDVDGTLTRSGQKIEPDMVELLTHVKSLNEYELGIVGGGTYDKIIWQLDLSKDIFTYIFAESGSIVYHNGIKIYEKNMLEFCNRGTLNKLIRTALYEIASMPIVYHGNQIDFRKGLIYVSPPGIQATLYERNIFIDADSKYNIRSKLINKLKNIDFDKEFEIVKGGSVGIAISPIGWNKSQVLTHLNDYNIIYYFGDKVEPDGNDYPIYSHPDVKGIAVSDYIDTINKINIIIDNKKNE